MLHCVHEVLLFLVSGLWLPVFLYFFAGCPCCGTPAGSGCDDCIDGEYPLQVEAVIASLANGSCTDSAAVNGTHALDCDNPPVGSPTTCNCFLDLDMCGQTDTSLKFHWILDLGFAQHNYLEAIDPGVGILFFFRTTADIADPFDCMGLSASLGTKGSAGGHYNVASATCNVNAVA